MLSGDGKTRRAGLSGVVASLVVAVPCVTRQVTWPPCACLGNGLSARVRRRRSGARCWLDQELVRPVGVTHYRPAAAVSLCSDRHHRTLRTEAGGSVGMLADELDYVVGVDTHLDEHVLAVVVAPSGAAVARRSVRANGRGYSAALQLADTHAKGARVWAIEGTGSYGAGLARYLAEDGETVLEISRTPRAARRLRGKDDALDAARTARAALASETLALPRSE